MKTTRGKEFVLDDDDYLQLSGVRFYSSGRYVLGWDKSIKKLFLLHRLLVGVFDERCVDHVNGDIFDNRKCNLRIGTLSQNQYNKRKTKNHATSKFKGVTKQKNRNRYRAQIKFNKKTIHLGSFENETDAAAAYDVKAKELFGEFSLTNGAS